MAGEDLDPVGELEQPLQGVEEALRALRGSDGEIGPGGIADEQRVASEHEPRLVAARVVDNREAAVLRPMAGRVDDAKRDGADLDLVAVAHRVVRVVDAGVGVDADRDAVFEREPAVPGDVVGMRVRLDRADDRDALPFGFGEQRLDHIRRVDEHGNARFFVSDEVTRAARGRHPGTGGRSRCDRSTRSRYGS